ncbi:hypothetical protein CLIB1444_02S17392 [[Candida] jaroonii]|uniref:Uncharacterized protein n=1 Tax=[Candida] jaroonii TaxID=467808 RepID=A0ACA9Y4B4_9ASCO|nr:hypothetical protein CLIB1444_02S17392 [[Candida] jaroonii]
MSAIVTETSEPGEDLRRLLKSDSDSWLVTGSVWSSNESLRSRFRSIENRRERKLAFPNISLPIPQVPENSFGGKSPLILSPNDIISASETISPHLKESYSPSTPTINQKGFKNYKLVEELYSSEKSYINSLHLLQKYYLSPLLDSTRSACGVPLYIMSENVDSIIIDHERFCGMLGKQLDTYDSGDVDYMNRKIGELVQILVENHYRYIEYCDVYEDVLSLSKLHEDDTGVNNTWTNGWNHYLEATQPPARKLDLSFMSLVQKPTARYGKYRLFLEALLQSTFKDFNCVDENLTTALIKVKSKLELIDFDASVLKKIDEADLLVDLIDFNGCGFARQFFGKSILIGSLVVAWIEIDRLKAITVAVILFKSHLVLCDVTRGNKKYPIIFIIPLSKSMLVEDNKDSDGGIFSSYPYGLKILFEIGKAQYEILLAAISKQEFQIWKDTLKTLINVVNGPYKLDFSMNEMGMNLIHRKPLRISPFNVSLVGMKKSSNDCYFQRPISIKIYNSIYNATNQNLIAEYWNINQPQDFDESLELTRYDRIKAEKKVSLIWSQEIPRIMYEKNPRISRHISLLHFHSFRSQTLPKVELAPVQTPIIPQSHFSFSKTAIPPDEEMFTARTHHTLHKTETSHRTETPHSTETLHRTKTLNPNNLTDTLERSKISRVTSFKSEIFNLFRTKSLQPSPVKPSDSIKSIHSTKSFRSLFRKHING